MEVVEAHDIQELIDIGQDMSLHLVGMDGRNDEVSCDDCSDEEGEENNVCHNFAPRMICSVEAALALVEGEGALGICKDPLGMEYEEKVWDTQTWVCTLHHGGHKDGVGEVEGGNHDELGEVHSI